MSVLLSVGELANLAFVRVRTGHRVARVEVSDFLFLSWEIFYLYVMNAHAGEKAGNTTAI